MESKDFANIVINKEQAILLNGMFHATEENPDFMHWIQCNGRSEEFAALATIIRDARHAKQWCEDPKCEHNKNV